MGRPLRDGHKKKAGIDYFPIIFDVQVFRDLKRLSAMENLTPNQFLKLIMPFIEAKMLETAIKRNRFVMENCQGESAYGVNGILEGDNLIYRVISAKAREYADEWNEKMLEKRRKEAIEPKPAKLYSHNEVLLMRKEWEDSLVSKSSGGGEETLHIEEKVNKNVKNES